MQRIRELSIQSANGNQSQTERNAMQAEVDPSYWKSSTASPRHHHFRRPQTADGSFGTELFQVGSNANETIDVSILISGRRLLRRRHRHQHAG
jgi:flagellin